MTEPHSWLEHMRAGEPFEMPDWDFLRAVFKAQEKVAEFNSTPPTQYEKRIELLRCLLAKFGDDAWIEPVLSIDLGFNTEIGERSFLNKNCTLLDTYPIRIGCDVQIGPSTMLFSVGHPVLASERNFRDPATGKMKGITSGAPIVIEDEVWLGGGVIVLPGVTIGARTTIGAGAVVTKSIPADVFAAGNPCRVIRKLT